MNKDLEPKYEMIFVELGKLADQIFQIEQHWSMMQRKSLAEKGRTFCELLESLNEMVIPAKNLSHVMEKLQGVQSKLRMDSFRFYIIAFNRVIKAMKVRMEESDEA